MKYEIKEILNEIGYYQHIHENLTLSHKELDILVDYINNLQTIEQQYSAILSENAELENKITNLQEENKNLKDLKYFTTTEIYYELEKRLKDMADMIDELSSKYYDLQEETERQSKAQVILDNQITEMLKYKQRNEKAIEYLKENASYTDNNDFVDDLRYDNCKELLDILKGDKDE